MDMSLNQKCYNIDKNANLELERELSFWDSRLSQITAASGESYKIFDLLDELWFGFNAKDDFRIARCRNSSSVGSLACITPTFSHLDTDDNSLQSDLDKKPPQKAPPYPPTHGPFSNPTIQYHRTSMESTQSSWKERQWRFPNQHHQKQKHKSDQNLGSFCKSAPRPVPNAGGCKPVEEDAAEKVSEDKILQAAWKWRFARKWGEEQRKRVDGQWRVDSSATDEWHMALTRIDDNHNLQFGNLGVSGTISTKLTSESFGSELLGKTSETPEAAPGDIKLSSLHTNDSTHDLKNIYSKVKTLAAERDRIEEEAERKWNLLSSNQSTWAGQHLEMVQISPGTNQNIVLYEISDPLTERSKLIVFGDVLLLEQLDQQFTEKVEKIVRELEVQQPVVEILGVRNLLWDAEGKKIEIGSFVAGEQATKKCTAHPDEALQWMITLLSQSLPDGMKLQIAK